MVPSIKSSGKQWIETRSSSEKGSYASVIVHKERQKERDINVADKTVSEIYKN
jgi:hypothetical protein